MKLSWWPYSWVGHPVRAVVISQVWLFTVVTPQMGADAPRWVQWSVLMLVTILAGAFLFAPRHVNASISVVAAALTALLSLSLLDNAGSNLARIQLHSVVPTLYAAFLVGAQCNRRWQRIFAVWLAVGLFVVAYSNRSYFRVELGMNTRDFLLSLVVEFAVYVMIVGFFWLLGVNNRRRQQDRAAIEARAEMASVMERTRIAREMHDIVAHSLSGIIAQADGARYAAAANPQVATDTLGTISQSARQSLKEMRGLLSVLRTDQSRDLTAAPGIAELQVLIDDARRSGLALDVSGLERLDGLPELLQFTMYRIVQEMLTNMLKHASVREGSLRVETDAHLIRITASNPAEPSDTPAGFGLVGMAERVKAHHGQLTHSLKEGRFTVTAGVQR